MSKVCEVVVGGRPIRFEFNKFAKQANGSVMISSGGTQVLVTVCADSKVKPDIDFFPLGVDYIEKSYAAGRIPGGYTKREGKPTDAATLTARVIDRPLRPCFPKGFRNETVITATVLSYEHGFSPAPLALIGASTALMISDIPFNGPVAALRVGLKNGEYIIDPLEGEEDELDLDLNIGCTPDAVLMVEAGARFLSEEQMLEAIEFAHKAMAPLFQFQLEIQKEIGKTKWPVPEASASDKELYEEISKATSEKFHQAFALSSKQDRYKALGAVEEEARKEFNPEHASAQAKAVEAALHKVKSQVMRSQILTQKRRIDGRGLTDIRPISCEIGLIKQTHGSSLFTRGETQALGVVTLASGEDQFRSETLWDVDLRERFTLHYNFPPFSVGEARMQRSPGRREVGHGNLAKRALAVVLPETVDFGYTIRLVSEVLESNGSSSMATVCAGTMAMLNAGVPLKSRVAGIAMGLIKEGDDYSVLSDILGDEDHLGDMDFKVCGDDRGITALQMDIKIRGITKEIMREALEQAREGRMHILGKMADAITEPEKMSKLAPRMFKVRIPQDKIRDLIGPSGKNIKKITAEAGVKIDIEESGIVNIVAPDITSAQVAKSLIRSLTATPKIGEIYLGRVIKVVEFGAFIEVKPGLEGLCHITQLAEERVERVEDVIKEGDELMVKIIDMDKQGRIKLSRKEALGQKPTFYRG